VPDAVADGTSAARRGAVIREIVLRGAPAPGEQLHVQRAQVYLRRELSCDVIHTVPRCAVPEVVLGLHDWQNPRANVLGFDRLLASTRKYGDFRLVLRGKRWLRCFQPAFQILTRYQRLLPLPAELPVMPELSRVLEAHSAAFAERSSQGFERSLDIWRWSLRLGRAARAAVQLAALFGELEADPLATPAKSGTLVLHARERLGSAEAANRALEGLELPSATLGRMTELILRWDAAPADPEQALLRDARDLSFFSLGSWTYLRDQGALATERHVRKLLARMSDRAICLARMTRQPREISDMIQEHFEHAPDALPYASVTG
jgi:hypothetical protein